MQALTPTLAGPTIEARAATLVNLGVWGAVALWSAVSTWIAAQAAGQPLGLGSFVLYFVPAWSLWALVTWGLFRLVRSPVRDRRQGLRRAAQLVAFGLAWALAYSLAMAAFEAWLNGWSNAGFKQLVLVRINLWAYMDLVIFGCLAVAIYGVSYYLRFVEQARLTAELRQQLVQGELRALRAQLQPHFLFNTLNSIASLIRTDDRATALSVLAGISDLLRDVLAADETPWRPLAEEVGFAERYLEIQAVRFGDRLRFQLDVDPRVAKVAVPRLVLQPLVENAVLHGIAPRREGGCVHVDARPWDGGGLEIVLRNPAPARPATETPASVQPTSVQPATAKPVEGASGHGTGLDNLRARLARLYDGSAALQAGEDDGPGWRVTLGLPPRPEGR